MNARAASLALVLLAAVPAAAGDRTFAERGAAPGPVHLLVIQGGRFFALRTRVPRLAIDARRLDGIRRACASR